MPDLVDCLQGILTVIPLQLLSFHIAVLRGFDVSTTYHISVDISRLHWGMGFRQNIVLVVCYIFCGVMKEYPLVKNTHPL